MRSLQFGMRIWRDQTGAIAANVAICVGLFLALMALTVDFGSVYVEKTRLQNTADAAALAGASALPDDTVAITRADETAALNYPENLGKWGDVLAISDITIGTWEADTRTFTPASESSSPINAVRAQTRREEVTGNPLPSIFGGVVGFQHYNVGATAIALGSILQDCFVYGFVSNGLFEAGSQDYFGPSVCIHGQDGIKIGSENEFAEGSMISMPDLDMLEAGSTNLFNGEMIEQELLALDDDAVEDLVQSIRDASGPSVIGDLQVRPDWWDGTVIRISSDFNDCTPVSGKLYIVSGVADLSSCTGTLSGFGIYSDKELKIGGGSSGARLNISNVILISKTTVETASYINIGDPSFCTTGSGSVLIAAGDFIKLGSNINVWGTQMIAGAKDGKLSEFGIDIGSNLTTHSLAAQSAGYIKLGSDPDINECGRSDHLFTVPGDGGSVRLVD